MGEKPKIFLLSVLIFDIEGSYECEKSKCKDSIFVFFCVLNTDYYQKIPFIFFILQTSVFHNSFNALAVHRQKNTNSTSHSHNKPITFPAYKNNPVNVRKTTKTLITFYITKLFHSWNNNYLCRTNENRGLRDTSGGHVFWEL